jgi:hypothetical protein
MRCLLLVAVLLSACGDDGGGYASFQSCFDHFDSSESRKSSIIDCCNRTIGGADDVCGTSSTTCASYVTQNLAPTSASQDEVIEACDDWAQ